MACNATASPRPSTASPWPASATCSPSCPTSATPTCGPRRWTAPTRSRRWSWPARGRRRCGSAPPSLPSSPRPGHSGPVRGQPGRGRPRPGRHRHRRLLRRDRRAVERPPVRPAAAAGPGHGPVPAGRPGRGEGDPALRDLRRRRLPARAGPRPAAQAAGRRPAPGDAAAGRPRERRRHPQLARPRRRRHCHPVRPRGRPGTEIAARIFVAATGDLEQARGLGRRALAAYLNVPVYKAFHQWLGRGERLAPMWAAWEAGDRRGALAALPTMWSTSCSSTAPVRLPGAPGRVRRGRGAHRSCTCCRSGRHPRQRPRPRPGRRLTRSAAPQGAGPTGW